LKLLIQRILEGLTRLSDFLVALGPFGLFGLALLDSTFVPLPSSTDALMILLAAAHPSWMIIYALLATSGSAIGCLILYYISRRAGSRALSRFSPSRRRRVKELPFKLFVITAGVFRFSVMRFIIAIVAGRAFRFLLEGYFAVRYGAQAKAVLARYYPWIGLGLAVVIIIGFVIRSLLKRKPQTGVEPGLEAGN
jgi:membrane protein YqaA with SNARE-associated domain